MNSKKHEWTVVALWSIAIFATLYVTRNTGLFTYLAPVYFMCMLGSLFTVRLAQKNRPQ